MSQAILLALGVAAALLLLTLAGEALRARVPPGRTVPGIETFNARVQSLVGHVGPPRPGAPARPRGRGPPLRRGRLREFATYTVKAREDHGTLAVAFFVVLPLQVLRVALGAEGLFTVFVPVHAFLLLPLLSVLMGAPPGSWPAWPRRSGRSWSASIACPTSPPC